MASVTVVGTGYVGLVTGVCLSKSGHTVTCVDIDPKKVDLLRSGRSPIFEPGVEDLLAEGIAAGTLRFETPANGWRDLVGDVTFVAVGTPMAPNGSADLSAVRAAVSSLAREADRPFVLVMKSTVPPGTGAALTERYLRHAATPIAYVSNPEFLREGHAVDDWFHTDRIVLGSDDAAALETMRALYADIEAPVLATDVTSAETIKYASNAFLSTKISFINEIANLCDCIGADIDAVARGLGLDARIGAQFLKAGIGYGGSCFPKDTRALDFISTLNGYQFTLLKSVIEVNNRQRLLPVVHLTRAMRDMHDRSIAVLGLSFKPDTDDVRESPALDIVPLLVEEGADVRAYDPIAAPVLLPSGARRTETVWEALDGASAAVVVTEWREFMDLDWARARELMRDPAVVFDGRNCLDSARVSAAGLTYMAVGRPGAHRGA
ncbi:UDP-glucose/GDP-mannose dehydrogenase family protein [Coriobacteriia bacterium Es71-Z0120]|uniref:UDP-glucose dehydrogenase family protein n=1 Tax=Parvivirga hydrogeniphila TaxID=2939460 RepID=UPI0022608B0C|nr:UDP-glucose/GDP-mannose dehydrogenase family protein [Parvivirga hydrogeniphila]MCL4078787.1 UDP-glucose/GDP-mannose dehydrogenase family protein [Parvivirga hydrogeniphila]